MTQDCKILKLGKAEKLIDENKEALQVDTMAYPRLDPGAERCPQKKLVKFK